MALSHDIGDRIELRASFVNSVNAFADPTTITYRVLSPDNAASVYTYALAQVTKMDTGRYQVFVVPYVSGQWFWRAEATGAVTGAVEGSFFVDESELVDG